MLRISVVVRSLVYVKGLISGKRDRLTIKDFLIGNQLRILKGLNVGMEFKLSKKEIT